MALLRDGNKLRRWATLRVCAGFLLVLAMVSSLVAILPLSPSYAQGSENSVKYSPRSSFFIPFVVEREDRPLQEVQLYVSDDRGQTWQKYATVRPEDKGFNFRADRDGLYWFTVRTVEIGGKATPASVQGTQPQLKMHIDTQPPQVTLRQAPLRDGVLGVEWDIRDDNLDLSTFNLEYRTPASVEWIPLTVEPSSTGQRYWNPGTTGNVEVHLRIRDLAKNEGKGDCTVSLGGTYRPASSPGDADYSRSTERSDVPTLWVNSKKISLSYEIKDKGPSGISAIELWFTRIVGPGRKWERYDNPVSNPQSPYVFDVVDEGVYGFILRVINGVGLADAPPATGDPPQVWVEVDLHPPIVHWVNSEVGRGADTGSLTITWRATDKNLGKEPINILYAADTKGPWTKVAENMENTGRYVWRKGQTEPHKFWIRVDATDKAGNVGSVVMTKPTLFDLAQPKSVIVGVSAADAKQPVVNDQGQK
jgi:hypothetical protein